MRSPAVLADGATPRRADDLSSAASSRRSPRDDERSARESVQDDERSPRVLNDDDSTASRRSARKDDASSASKRSVRKDNDDDLASVVSAEQDSRVAKAKALRLLLAFEDSGKKLKKVLKKQDYTADQLLDAFAGREHLKEIGADEADALIDRAGDGMSVTRRALADWLKLERSRLCEELMKRLDLGAPAPAPAPAPAVPEGVAQPMSPLSPSPSVSSQREAFEDLLFSRLDTMPREAGAAAAAAEAAARQRSQDRARALAQRHRRAAREGRISRGEWASSSFRLKPVKETVPLTNGTASVKLQAAYRGFKSRVGRRRDRRAVREIQTAYRAYKARFAAKVLRRRRKRLEKESNERHDRATRLSKLRGELERLKASPAELASTYATVHAKRREERLRKWQQEEDELLMDAPGDDYTHPEDVVEDYSVGSTPTKSTKSGDSVERVFNGQDEKENLSDADAIERRTISMYRKAVHDETFAQNVAKGLAVELPPTLIGPDPDSKEETELRLKDLRERVERKAKARHAKTEATGLDAVKDPRGAPVLPFGEPLKWIPSKKFKRRPMIASLLQKAQQAEANGGDGDAAISEEMRPFMEKAREELTKKKGYTPGFVDDKGEACGVKMDASGTTGAQRTYVEYFQAKARARELMIAKRATDPERVRLREERDKILKRAQGLAERLRKPPLIELSSSLGEPADLDLNDPEEGSDDPRGWWRLPQEGPDRERAYKAHRNAVEAWENRDQWFYASVPEDAAGPGIDIRKALAPNVPWPFPSKHLRNVPGPEPMDPDTASLYWYAWARKGLEGDLDSRTQDMLERADQKARRETDASSEGVEAAVVAARARVQLAADSAKGCLRDDGEALLERCKLGPEGRLLQARDYVKQRREHVNKLAKQYEYYMLGQKLLGKKAGPAPWEDRVRETTEAGRAKYVVQLQAWWRGQGYRRRTRKEKRDRRVVNALATLVAELGGDASGVAAAASGLSDVFSQRKKAWTPAAPRATSSRAVPASAAPRTAVRFSSDEGGAPSRPPSAASSRRPSAHSVPEAAPPAASPSPRPSVDEVADEPRATPTPEDPTPASSARPSPRQQLFAAETPAVAQERSAKMRAAEMSAYASARAKQQMDEDANATGPPRL